MGGQHYKTGDLSGSQYEKRANTSKANSSENRQDKIRPKKDEDLIIEENTIYEIDRECYERLKRQKKKK